MALAHCPLALPPETTEPVLRRTSILTRPLTVLSSSVSRKLRARNFLLFSQTLENLASSFNVSDIILFVGQSCLGRGVGQFKSKPEESEASPVAETFNDFKQLLLPVIDRHPYLTEGTKQATATTAALAKKYGAEITVVVIDEKEKETLSQHEAQLASIRWHLSEGGFREFKLLERLGEGNKPTAIIGEVADEMNMDLVIMSMEAIHSKHVDANLLAEFIPCPVLLLPL
ncbi:hypothetical protein Sango_1828700 [Sesamum angolense]|uniref:Universal stress protein n=1 Tax=Sesamum angolense TaxID=2727404 RepID=A0AAE1WHJ2_9LAMI|nr:hypothetical protein Sango_1828700 [Sesamum angolense]